MTTAATRQGNLVGVELTPGEEAEAVGAACCDADENVSARAMPAAIYIEAPDRLEIRMDEVSEHLGRDFTADDLQMIMASYFGVIDQWDDEAVVLCWSDAP